MSPPIVVQVVVDKPLAQGFDYVWDAEKLGSDPEIGQLVEVPFGCSKLVGLIIKVSTYSVYEIDKLRHVLQIAPLPPLDGSILRLTNFASQYYIHGLGETVIPAIPQMWKKPSNWKKIDEQQHLPEKKRGNQKKSTELVDADGFIQEEQLNEAQKKALKQLCIGGAQQKFSVSLLHGQTGSGKTAVFLNWLQSILRDENSQALILVPEINLTPQLERRVRAYFPNKRMVVLHSGVSEKKRGIAWQEAVIGKAQIVLGTRLAALTPMPNLRAIVVDEEHDASYKQQDGIRYSARDLAVWRAHDTKIPILLSSATPSLETWMAAKAGRYQSLRLDQRAQGASLPKVHLVNTRDPQNQFSPGDLDKPPKLSLSKPLVRAINTSLQSQKQCLVLINRRGYSPVLSCSACSWLSKCPQCSSYTVMHKAGALGRNPTLSCHHCGLAKPVPTHCPDCGNADLKGLGQGTQKLEDLVEQAWPNARVLRIDTDSSRKGKVAEPLFQEIHEGNVNIVVGTQMIAKGHDFQNIGMVAVLDADSRLFSQDFRAAERLFAQLVQVAGRAGRNGKEGERGGEIYIETQFPESAVYQYLLRHDVDGFLSHIAVDREEAKLPPFSYQGLVYAEAKSLEKAIGFLSSLKRRVMDRGHMGQGVRVYDPVPRSMVKVAGVERAQLVVESDDRKQLQEVLDAINLDLREISQGRISKGGKDSKEGQVRWLIERDPISI